MNASATNAAARASAARGTAHHDHEIRQFAALGTTAVVATTIPNAIDAAEAILRAELQSIDQACSRFRADSELSLMHLNRCGPVVVSQLLAEAVGVALEVAAVTGGAVDPTVGSSMLALGYDRDFSEIAADGTSTAEFVERVAGWRCVEFEAEQRRVHVPTGVLLDLGATAKALAADRAAWRIAHATGSGVLVNLGGDIAVAGPAPADGWAVGLALDCATSPEDTDVVVAIRSGGLASSGTAVRTWRRGDRQVHHIIDPSTGDCAETCWRLVSVTAASCVEANAASTAAIVWGATAPARLTTMGLPCRLVGDDGRVVTLGGWPPDPIRKRSRTGTAAA